MARGFSRSRPRTAAAWNGFGNIYHSATPTLSVAAPETFYGHLAQERSITGIDVVTVRDGNDTAPVTDTETFASYGLIDYTVELWNGAALVKTIAVAGNDKVLRQFTFAAVTATEYRIIGTRSPDGYMRLQEVRVWGY